MSSFYVGQRVRIKRGGESWPKEYDPYIGKVYTIKTIARDEGFLNHTTEELGQVAFYPEEMEPVPSTKVQATVNGQEVWVSRHVADSLQAAGIIKELDLPIPGR